MNQFFTLVWWPLLLLASCSDKNSGKSSGDSGQAPDHSKTMPETKEGYNIFQTNAYNIQYPLDWERNDSAGYNIAFVLLAPSDGNNDAFRENVVLAVFDLSGYKISLDMYADRVQQQVLKELEQSEILENSEETNAQGNKFRVLRYSGYEEDEPYVFVQHIHLNNGKAYCLTFTAENQYYYNYKERGDNILRSFELK